MTGAGRGEGPRGSTLVEVVVALAVFEVGAVAAAGLLVEAGRVAARAALAERARGALAVVADSLLDMRTVSPGRRAVDGLDVRWTPGAGSLRLEAARPGPGAPPDGEPVLAVEVPW